MANHTTATPDSLSPHAEAPAARTNWRVPAGLMALSAIPTLAGLIRVIALARGAPAVGEHARFAAAPVPTALHIVGATSFALLGALQFAEALRSRRRAWHRVAGRVLAPLGIVGALAGMWMAATFPANEYNGPLLAGMRLVAGAAMAAFIALGLAAAARRDFAAHGDWMTRGYALGAAAGTQALLLGPAALAGSMHARTYALVMAAGWVLNAAVAEWVIRRGTGGSGAHAKRADARAPGERAATMLAVVYDRYGGPEVLRVARVARPSPGAGQVRVRVHAASINAADYRLMRADPFLARLEAGIVRPTRRPILGADVAGVVEAVGPGVTTLSVGDEVFGETFADGLGGFAESACVRASALARKPEALSFVEAAAVPLASITALQAVRERARVRPGQSVLIQGAGGGVGVFLVQIAKAYGARVTAVCGPGSVELVRSLGADRVLDYTREDPAREDERYDAVFGVNGYRSLGEYVSLLAPGGTYVMVGGTNRQLFEALVLGKLRFVATGRRIEVLTTDARHYASDLRELGELLAAGALRVVVDRVFPLADAADAMRHVERGHVRGKVVLDASAPGAGG